jgi:hypothetical protein
MKVTGEFSTQMAKFCLKPPGWKCISGLLEHHLQDTAGCIGGDRMQRKVEIHVTGDP